MTTAAQRGKVMVLKGEPSVWQPFIFMRQLERGNAPGRSQEPPSDKFNRRQFDKIIVDLRCPRQQPRNEVYEIGEVRLSLVGRALAITIQVSGPKTLGMVEQHLRGCLSPSLLWLVCHCQIAAVL